MKIDEKDISYSYNSRGYMMYYKGQPIGGAGIAASARGHRSNLKLFRDHAEVTKRSIMRGGETYMQEQIKKIDADNAD